MAITNQPTNMNYLSPVNFDLQINKLPNTKYFCTGVTLPGVNFSEALHSLPLAINSYLPGDKIEFDPLKLLQDNSVMQTSQRCILMLLYLLILHQTTLM